jgi:hypothetical protein
VEQWREIVDTPPRSTPEAITRARRGRSTLSVAHGQLRALRQSVRRKTDSESLAPVRPCRADQCGRRHALGIGMAAVVEDGSEFALWRSWRASELVNDPAECFEQRFALVVGYTGEHPLRERVALRLDRRTDGTRPRS